MIRVEAQGRALPLRVSGLVNFGAAASIGGATLAGFDLRPHSVCSRRSASSTRSRRVQARSLRAGAREPDPHDSAPADAGADR